MISDDAGALTWKNDNLLQGGVEKMDETLVDSCPQKVDIHR